MFYRLVTGTFKNVKSSTTVQSPVSTSSNDSCSGYPANSNRGVLLTFALIPIADHLHFLDRNQSATHHFIKCGQECVDLFIGVDDFDDYWKVHGQPKDLRSVQVTSFSEGARTVYDKCAKPKKFPHLFSNESRYPKSGSRPKCAA